MMKSPAQSLKLALLVVLAGLGLTTSAMAQNPRIQISQLDALASKASETVDVSLDEKLMALAGRFLSNQDEDDKKVKELVNGLKGIYVKSFSFDTEGQYSEADIESVRSQLRNAAWTKIVNVSSKKEGSCEIYLMQNGGQISGLALIATEAKEITVVNIVGPIDLDKLSQLEGNFGVPELDLEITKPKRKN